MIQITSVPLPKLVSEHLIAKQTLIDDEADYAAQVAKGKALWKSKSVKQFNIVRSKLEKMCVGKRRCNYCEDSAADEVEHIAPKDLFPDKVFRWSNYLFACGPCNGPKNNKFAVFDANDGIVNITRGRKEPVVPPQRGEHVFINPRNEDPLEFMLLELNTCLFVAKPGLSDRHRKRAEYTISTLTLNARDYLVKARKEAYGTYRDSLELYVQKKEEGASQTELARRREELNSRQHPTVWYEMKRLNQHYPTLRKLFEAAPELL